jgi:phage terminase large subunit-like protein
MKSISLIHFIDKLIKNNELGQPFRLSDHQREVLRLAFAFDENGRLPYDTVIFSCPKKSGKTTLNAALTLWWAITQEPPNELLCVANDLEQSLARVYRSIENISSITPS